MTRSERVAWPAVLLLFLGGALSGSMLLVRSCAQQETAGALAATQTLEQRWQDCLLHCSDCRRGEAGHVIQASGCRAEGEQ